MYYKPVWEQVVGDKEARYVRRMKTPGGWLVSENKRGLCYVPDPGHDWQFEEEKKEIKFPDEPPLLSVAFPIECPFYKKGRGCAGIAKAPCTCCSLYRDLSKTHGEVKCPFYKVGERCSGPGDDSSKVLCHQCSCYADYMEKKDE